MKSNTIATSWFWTLVVAATMLNNAVVFEAVQGFTVVPPATTSTTRTSTSSIIRQLSVPSSKEQQQLYRQSSSLTSSAIMVLSAKRGFGEQKKKKEKSTGQIKREQEGSKYEEIANSGGQEYTIFVRQFGSDDKSWLPCGAIAVPRSAQVSDAIYANVDSLKGSIVRTYPKLAGYEEEFEFGFNLKIYPDDPVEVASKNAPRAPGLSVGNWLSTLFSPVDASKVPPPPMND